MPSFFWRFFPQALTEHSLTYSREAFELRQAQQAFVALVLGAAVLQAASALRVASREATTRCLRGSTYYSCSGRGTKDSLFSRRRYCTGTGTVPVCTGKVTRKAIIALGAPGKKTLGGAGTHTPFAVVRIQDEGKIHANCDVLVDERKDDENVEAMHCVAICLEC